MRRIILTILVAILLLFVLIQLIPYGHQHTNPPVIQEPNWYSPQTRELAKRACFDCHSNETIWPWYSNVAPVSWLVQRDVNEGRHHLNFSDWGHVRETDDIPRVIKNGDMPMPIFLIMHPEARLTQAEKDALISGVEATISGQ